jgi:hypothetical protein
MRLNIVPPLIIGGLFVLSLMLSPLPSATPAVSRLVYRSTLAPLAPTSPVAAPNTPTTATATPTPVDGSCASYVGLGLGLGWPSSEAAQLAEIMRSESGCTTTAVGDGGHSIGLLQIHCPTWVQPSTNWPAGWTAAHGMPLTCDQLHDPRTNLAVGLMIWRGLPGSGGGWHNWSTYTP